MLSLSYAGAVETSGTITSEIQSDDDDDRMPLYAEPISSPPSFVGKEEEFEDEDSNAVVPPEEDETPVADDEEELDESFLPLEKKDEMAFFEPTVGGFRLDIGVLGVKVYVTELANQNTSF